MIKRTLFCSISLLLFLSTLTHSQQSFDTEDNQKDSIIHNLDILNRKYDALFKDKKYNLIVKDIKLLLKSNLSIKELSDLNMHLIAAYFMLKDTVSSNKILKAELNNTFNYFNFSKPYLMANSNLYSFNVYLSIPFNRARFEKYVIENFENNEHNIQDFNLGISIIQLSLNDQYLKRDSSILKKSYFTQKESNFQQLFELYKRTGFIFGMQDIGNTLYRYQFELMWNDKDIMRRSYYLKLIKMGVLKKKCGVGREIDFILRTQEIEEGEVEFQKNLQQRIDTFKVKFKVPNYEFNNF